MTDHDGKTETDAYADRDRKKRDFENLRRRLAGQGRLSMHGYAIAPKTINASPSPVYEAHNDAFPGDSLAANAAHEIIPASYDDLAAAVGFGLALAARTIRAHPGAILWSFPSHHAYRNGMLYSIGMTYVGVSPNRIVQLSVRDSKSVLWALEEGLGNGALAAVIGVLPENDRHYDFAASRRLALRAKQNNIAALLVRTPPVSLTASAAETRWTIAAEPSAPQYYAGRTMPGVGTPRWRAQLTKAKRGKPGDWRVEWDYEALCFRLVSAMGDRAPLRPAVHAQRGWRAV